MRYTVLGYNQEIALEYELDLKDLLILNWMNMFYPKMHKHIEDDTEYVWVQYDYLIQELPILKLSKESISKRFSSFCAKDILKRKEFKVLNTGTFTYYSFTPKYYELFTHSSKNTSVDSSKNTSDNSYTNNSQTTSSKEEARSVSAGTETLHQGTDVLENNDNKNNKAEIRPQSNTRSDRYKQKQDKVSSALFESKEAKPKKSRSKSFTNQIKNFSDNPFVQEILQSWIDYRQSKGQYNVWQFEQQLIKLRGLTDTDENIIDTVRKAIAANTDGFFDIRNDRNVSQETSYDLPPQKKVTDEEKARDKDGNLIEF